MFLSICKRNKLLKKLKSSYTFDNTLENMSCNQPKNQKKLRTKKLHYVNFSK